MKSCNFMDAGSRLLVAGALSLISTTVMAERHWGAEMHRHGPVLRWNAHSPMERHHGHGHGIQVRPPRPAHVQHPMPHPHGWHPGSGHRHRLHRDHLYTGLGLLAGTALLYHATQPRTLYYNAPPQTTTIVTGRVDYPPVWSHANETVYISPTQTPIGLPARLPDNAATGTNAIAGPGDSGLQWRYVCRQPAGAYPHVQECWSGWEKQPLTQ